MAAMDFNKALDMKASEVKAVPLAPIGHYIWQVSAVPVINTEGRWNSVNFPVKCVMPYEDADDVDPEELATFGKIAGLMNRVSFLFDSEEGTETDLIQFQNQVKRFCGVTLSVEGADDMTLKELLNASVNKQFVGQLIHKADKRDPEHMHANIGRTAPIA